MRLGRPGRTGDPPGGKWGYGQKAKGKSGPTASYQLPATSYQLPVTSSQFLFPEPGALASELCSGGDSGTLYSAGWG